MYIAVKRSAYELSMSAYGHLCSSSALSNAAVNLLPVSTLAHVPSFQSKHEIRLILGCLYISAPKPGLGKRFLESLAIANIFCIGVWRCFNPSS